MKAPRPKRLLQTILISWSIVYVPYALFVAWVNTWPVGFDGKSVGVTDYLVAGIFIVMSLTQLTASIALAIKYRPRVSWIVMGCLILSVGSVIAGPSIAIGASLLGVD